MYKVEVDMNQFKMNEFHGNMGSRGNMSCKKDTCALLVGTISYTFTYREKKHLYYM